MQFNVVNHSFGDGDFIPKKYTCDGKDISPHISWKDVPKGTKSFVVIMSDPDAPVGTFIHWVLYDIPADVRELKEGGSVGVEGRNDFGKIGYRGPCPPRGHGKHRYFITVYALSVESLNLKKGADARTVIKAMKGKVIAQDSVMGIYERR